MMPLTRRFAVTKHLPSLLCMCVLMFAGAAAAYDSAECIDCHGKKDGGSDLIMDLAAYEASVHKGTAECTDCHTRVVDGSHMQTKGSGAADCSQCHDTVNDHGTAGPVEVRPACADCHSRHGILASSDPDATVHPDNLAATCGRCHESQTGRTDYLSWLPSVQINSHPKQDFGGAYGTDNCIGCHQGKAAHGQPRVIDETGQCHRCHMTPDGKSALWGVIHARADLAEQPGTWLAGGIYQLFLLTLLGFGGACTVARISRRSQSQGD